MRKLLYIFCVLFLTTTVYASDLNVQGDVKDNILASQLLDNKNFLSIVGTGEIAYIIDEEEKDALIVKLEDIIKSNEVTQQNDEDKKLQPVAGFKYRVSFYTNGADEKPASIFFIESSGKINVIVNETLKGETWIPDVELNQLLSSVETLFEKKHKYDSFLSLNTMNLTELGSVLNGKLYIFENAFIDSQGSLYISLEDWDNIFSPTYGNTKKLSMGNNEVIHNYKPTNIPTKMIENRIYIPLRNAVDYFSHFNMNWDRELRKVVISEKITKSTSKEE
ncbi:hypothetical protein DSECCO2_112970 [anaerobic digester metagenome]